MTLDTCLLVPEKPVAPDHVMLPPPKEVPECRGWLMGEEKKAGWPVRVGLCLSRHSPESGQLLQRATMPRVTAGARYSKDP